MQEPNIENICERSDPDMSTVVLTFNPHSAVVGKLYYLPDLKTAVLQFIAVGYTSKKRKNIYIFFFINIIISF